MTYEIELKQCKKRRWPIALIVFLVVVFAASAAYLAHQNYMILSPSDGSPVTGHESRMYNCPMHPTYTSDKPGTCPICGMNLVPMDGMESHEMDHMKPEPPGHAAIKLTPTQRQTIGVTTAKAEMRSLTKEIRTVGTVAFDPALAVAQKAYLTARRLGDTSLTKAAKDRLILMGMSEDQVAKLKKAGRVQKNLYLPTPKGTVWIYSKIYEVDIPYVKQGQVVRISIPSSPEVQLTGIISSLDPVLDQKDRTITVRSEVEDPQGLLKPNVYVNVYIVIPLGESLAVPADAILWSDTAQFVFVDEGEGKLVPREVKVGSRTDDYAPIISGLNSGETVVTSPNFLIDAESQLKATIQKMRGSMKSGGHEH